MNSASPGSHHDSSRARCAALTLSAAILALVFAPRNGAAQDAVYRFIIPTVEATAGQDIRVTIQGEHTESAQGFSMAFRYPSGDLTIREVHYKDTILEAIKIDYFEPLISPQNGTFVLGVLVDSVPPFTGELIPSIGMPLDFVHLEVTVSSNAKSDLHIRFEDGLSVPPVNNIYAVNNQPVRVTELGDGVINVAGDGRDARFLRGDANMDVQIDVSDPIQILASLFLGESGMNCAAAADANDDDLVDVSDPIFLLEYLFSGGRPPPPPELEPGPDPTPGSLGCEGSLEVPAGG